MSKDSNNVRDAISDLAALRPYWTLLADTIPADFLRQVKAEIESLTVERDTYLESIRGTFRVLELHGQAPDDNAPLAVTVRRVLDFLDKVTAERDALRQRIADAVPVRVCQRYVCEAAMTVYPDGREVQQGTYVLVPLKEDK